MLAHPAAMSAHLAPLIPLARRIWNSRAGLRRAPGWAHRWGKEYTPWIEAGHPVGSSPSCIAHLVMQESVGNVLPPLFHQAWLRLSKANVEVRLLCVNASRPASLTANHSLCPALANAGKLCRITFLEESMIRLPPLLVANFPHMNFSQMHERLRQELLRRIQRGTLSVSLLARQTGFGQAHLSNFLRQRRQLSLEAMDRILTAQHLAAHDLLPASVFFEPMPMEEDANTVPVVSHAAALFEPFIRPAAAQSLLHLPSGALQSARTRASAPRRSWQRFVAVHASADDAEAMDPLILPEALAVIDRHYNSLASYRQQRPTLYAVRKGAHLTLRYAEFLAGRLVLRAHSLACPVDLLEIEEDLTPNDLIAGRVALILNWM